MNFARYKPHLKPSFLLAYPVMLSQFGHVFMGITDNIMIGHTGTVPLAAAALANVSFNVLLLFGIGVSYAITPLVAEADGENDHSAISRILRHGLIINLATAFLLVATVMAVRNILYHIDQPAEVVEQAIPYLSILTFSIIPVLIFQTFRQFAEGLSNTNLAMIIVLGSNVIHIFMNYLFIYGAGDFPAMGLVGAGWATLLCRVLMAAAIVVYVYFAKKYRVYRAAFAFRDYSKKLFVKMLNIGIPAGTQFIFEVSAFDFSAVMMGWLGATTLAAHQIAINLAAISYMMISGIAATATIRVSTELGKGDFRTLRTVADTLIIMAMTFMTVCSVIFILGRNYLPSLYINDADVINIAAPLIVITGFFQLADGMQVVCIGALRGLQDVKIPSVFVFVAWWVIGLPLGYWLGFHAGFGAVGIWAGLLTGLTVTATTMFIRFRILSRNLMNSTAVPGLV